MTKDRPEQPKYAIFHDMDEVNAYLEGEVEARFVEEQAPDDSSQETYYQPGPHSSLSDAMNSEDIFAVGGHTSAAQQPAYGGTAGKPLYYDQYDQPAHGDKVFIDEAPFPPHSQGFEPGYVGSGAEIAEALVRQYTEGFHGVLQSIANNDRTRLALYGGSRPASIAPQMPQSYRAVEAPQQNYPEPYESQQTRTQVPSGREQSGRGRDSTVEKRRWSEATRKNIAKAALLTVVAGVGGVVAFGNNSGGESAGADAGTGAISSIPKGAKKVEVMDFTGSPADCKLATTYTSAGTGYFSVPYVSRAGNDRRYPNTTTFKKYRKGTNVNFANEIELGVCPIKGEKAFTQNGSVISIDLGKVALLAKAKSGSVFAAKANTRGLAKLKKSQRTQITNELKSKTMAAPQLRVEAMTAIVAELQKTQHDDMQKAAIEALKQYKLDEAAKNNQTITFADEVIGDVAQPTISRKDHFGDVYGDGSGKVLYLRKGVRLEVAGLKVTPKGTQS